MSEAALDLIVSVPVAGAVIVTVSMFLGYLREERARGEKSSERFGAVLDGMRNTMREERLLYQKQTEALTAAIARLQDSTREVVVELKAQSTMLARLEQVGMAPPHPVPRRPDG